MICSSTILALIGLTVAQPHGFASIKSNIAQSSKNRGGTTEVIINDTFDKNLPTIRKYILSQGMDPMRMPDYMLPLEFPLNPGKIHLQRGWVQNMVTIKRTGDIILRYNDLSLNFDLNLGWESMDVTYDYTMRYFSLTRKGSFNGRFNNLNLKIMGSIDLKTRYLKLDFLKFVDVENFTLKLEGHLADHLINVITRLLTLFAKERVLHTVEYQSIKIINEKIKEINDAKIDVVDDEILKIKKNN